MHFFAPVSVIGVLQIVVVIGGFLAISTPEIDGFQRVPSSVSESIKYLRNWGLLYLIVPFVWMFLTQLDMKYCITALPEGGHFTIGLILLFILCLVFFPGVIAVAQW